MVEKNIELIPYGLLRGTTERRLPSHQGILSSDPYNAITIYGLET